MWEVFDNFFGCWKDLKCQKLRISHWILNTNTLAPSGTLEALKYLWQYLQGGGIHQQDSWLLENSLQCFSWLSWCCQCCQNTLQWSEWVQSNYVLCWIEYLDPDLSHTLATSSLRYSAVWLLSVASTSSMKNVSLSAVMMWMVYSEDGFLVDPPLNINVRLTQVQSKLVWYLHVRVTSAGINFTVNVVDVMVGCILSNLQLPQTSSTAMSPVQLVEFHKPQIVPQWWSWLHPDIWPCWLWLWHQRGFPVSSSPSCAGGLPISLHRSGFTLDWLLNPVCFYWLKYCLWSPSAQVKGGDNPSHAKGFLIADGS